MPNEEQDLAVAAPIQPVPADVEVESSPAPPVVELASPAPHVENPPPAPSEEESGAVAAIPVPPMRADVEVPPPSPDDRHDPVVEAALADVEFPPPPLPATGYLRVAVVQLAFQPSAAVAQVHLLEQPARPPKDTWPNWFATGLDNRMRGLRACQKRIGKKVRAIYVEHESIRIAEILRACSAWGIHVVVFPEYSVPPECLVDLLPETKGMTAVLGTHSVEGHLVDDGFYAQFGVPVPTVGTSVSPVAIDGALKHFQPKLNSTHLEIGMLDGPSWDPIPLPSSPEMGILTCLDFIKREADQYRNRVGSKIDGCKIIAVPSLTPDYTIDRFEARAFDESVGYGRSALYADIASGGGTSIFAASALTRPTGRFPFGIPSLEVGEEGLIVADLDIEYTRTAEKVSRSYSDRKSAILVGAAVFRYRTVEKDINHLTSVNAMFGGVDLTSRADISRVLEQNEEALAALADASSATAASTLNDVLETRAQARTAEELLCRLRHVAFSDAVLPMPILEQLRASAALEEAEAFHPTKHEDEERFRLCKRLREICGGTT